MNIFIIIEIIYFIIGLYCEYYYWNKWYKVEYKEAEKHGTIENGMVSILILFIIFFWPLCVIYDKIKTMKNK